MVSATHAERRLTYDDFLLFPEGDGLRHEIIDGVHYVTAAPNLRHQDLVGRLHLAIGNVLASHPGVGRVFLSPVDVVFAVHDVVEPDLVFIAGDQTDIMTEANIQGAPAIAVACVSIGSSIPIGVGSRCIAVTEAHSMRARLCPQQIEMR